MTTYKIKPNGFDGIKKKLVPRMLLILGLLLAIAVFINYPRDDAGNSAISSLIMIILFGGILTFAWFRAMKTQRELFESNQLTIQGGTITRERKNTRTIKIESSEVKEIIKADNGSLVIKGGRRSDVIFVPTQIENFDELEQVLNGFSAIRAQGKKTYLEKYGLALPFLAVALMAIVYTVRDKYIVLTAGSCLVAFLIWSLVEIQISKNIDKTTKKRSYWTIIVILAMIGAMIGRFME